MPLAGLERSAGIPGETHDSQEGGGKSVAKPPQTFAEFASMINACPVLSQAVRQAMHAILKKAKAGTFVEITSDAQEGP